MKIPDNDKKVCFALTMLVANQFQTKLDGYMGDLTLKQWLLMCMVNNMEQEFVSINDLSKVMGYSRQNTKKLIDILVPKGYLSMEQSKLDKRAYNVKLTQKGFEYLSRYEQLGEQIMEKLYSGITEDQITLMRNILEQIEQNLEKM